MAGLDLPSARCVQAPAHSCNHRRPIVAARTVFSFRQTGVLLRLVGSVPCGWLPQRHIFASHLICISQNFLR
jgi:hypothetical protein